mmetsp:Transcript_6220/g.26057  ORF Transcript_6220/g.26057 Transcript_6220/m.26057 type:complete len:197 (+) Transcript_6220:48-638(+)
MLLLLSIAALWWSSSRTAHALVASSSPPGPRGGQSLAASGARRIPETPTSARGVVQPSSPRRRGLVDATAAAVAWTTTTTILGVGAAPAAADVGDVWAAAVRNNDVTYSQNGKNIQRMSRGDYSMGSRQTSTSERGLKRRAAMACKSPKALKEAGTYGGSESACTRDVLEGRTEAILAALDRLGDECKVDATHVCL